jgi:transcription antitermination protein NusB
MSASGGRPAGGADADRPAGRARRGHHRRRAARRQAIDALYEADVRELPPSAVVEEWQALGRAPHPYALELITGVATRVADIDRALNARASAWPVHRMPVVDRTILRVACYELWSGLPPAIVINEAVALATELSTDDSGRFVNGVLGQLVRDGPDASG